jgi:hypothetical protein
MNFYDMKLGDSFWHSGIGCQVVRVPGGWLFQTADSSQSSISSMSFVPFNNEFMENSTPAELAATDSQRPLNAIALCKRASEFKPKSDSECPMLLASLIGLMESVAQQQ